MGLGQSLGVAAEDPIPRRLGKGAGNQAEVWMSTGEPVMVAYLGSEHSPSSKYVPRLELMGRLCHRGTWLTRRVGKELFI